MTSLVLAPGQTVELNDGRKAVIRFLGPTQFAPGEWIGVELEDPSGKNDGSVKGDRYFECEANYGMFLRAIGVSRILETPRTQSRAPASRPGTVKSRPNSISTNASINTAMAAKRDSSALASGMRTPVRSPTKQLGMSSTMGSTGQAGTLPPRTETPPTAASRRLASVTSTTGTAGTTTTASTAKPRPGHTSTPSFTAKRSSVTSAPPIPSTATHRPRPSVSSQTSASRVSSARPPPVRQALAPPRVPSSSRLSSVPSNVSEDMDSQDSQPSPLPSPASERAAFLRYSNDQSQPDYEDDAVYTPPIQPPTSAPMRPPPRRTSSPPAQVQRAARTSVVPSRELEDCQAKLRIMERKRLEDRERLKKAADLEQERDKYASIIQKLQPKLQSQSQELAELKKQLKDSETSLLDIEAIQAEHDSIVEMATLDREMAEETAEVLKTEVEALRDKNEEMTLELEILREENQELGREMNPDERTSQGWLQMERSNERLRDALLRLRDITQEQEAELKDQINVLEEDVKDFATIKADYEDTKARLLATEADVDDLRQQLDAALGAEDMIEDLTERNMSLQEELEELRATVDDLESLKELNDELEVNHVEAEKQMQEEIDFKDSIINETLRRSAQQQQAIDDCEYTISRFRHLVTNLQADLEDMRASQQLTDKEAEDLSHRSRAMMDLNMKLQISASKTQIKTIDLELKRLEAEQAAEHLSIVQLFLPDAFQHDRDSVLALLRFKRISFKANLVHVFVKERVSGQSLNFADPNLFSACSVLDRLAWIIAMCERFVNSICACSVEDFAKYEGALYEIEPVERALNSYVEALKRDDLIESKVDAELQRSMAVMTHLASIHIRPSSSAFADDVLMQTALIQSHLETTATALSLCKSSVQANVPNIDQEEQAEDSAELGLIGKLDAFVSLTRSAKVLAGKTQRSLFELQSRSLALEPSSMEEFTKAEQAALALAAFARNAGNALQTLFGEEGREEPFNISEVNTAFSRLSATAFPLPAPEASILATVANRIRSLTNQLSHIGTIPADLDNTIEFDRSPAPWVIRSADIRSTKLTSVDTEAEVARLTEIIRERSVLVRTKEQELEEQGVRIEMLEARMAEAQKRSAQLSEREASLQVLKQTEQDLNTQLSDAQTDLTKLRQERDDLQQQLTEYQAATKSTNAPNVEYSGGASRVELDRAKAQEKNLQAAIRYLQAQTSPASTNSSASDLGWLEEPLFTTPTPQQRQLSLLESETKSAFSELLNVVIKSEPVKINPRSAKSRLAWRPAQETTAWATQKRHEEWEAWKEWQCDLLNRAKGVNKRTLLSSATAQKPVMEDRAAVDGVVIVGEDDVEDFGEQEQEQEV